MLLHMALPEDEHLELKPETYGFKKPNIGRVGDPERAENLDADQLDRAIRMGLGGEELRKKD